MQQFVGGSQTGWHVLVLMSTSDEKPEDISVPLQTMERPLLLGSLSIGEQSWTTIPAIRMARGAIQGLFQPWYWVAIVLMATSCSGLLWKWSIWKDMAPKNSSDQNPCQKETGLDVGVKSRDAKPQLATPREIGRWRLACCHCENQSGYHQMN